MQQIQEEAEDNSYDQMLNEGQEYESETCLEGG